MKTTRKNLILVSTVLLIFTFGCGSKNSVKDNSGDNIHQEDQQDENFYHKDSTAYNKGDSAQESGNRNK
jgi:hypothetical protein